MNIQKTTIEGVFVVEQKYGQDNRGFFGRLFCQQALSDIIGRREIIQINHSCTHEKGSVRGLHYQHQPVAEMKLIRCIKGKIFDVAVDLRQDSATFLNWYGHELSADNHKMMVVPEGCAHGFQVLEENSEMIYLHTAPYRPESEAGVSVNDPKLAINWPLPVEGLSERDKSFAFIGSDFSGVEL